MSSDPKKITEKLNKPQMNLLPGKALLSVAKILGFGAEKHGAYSWKEYPKEAYVAAIGRHWAQILDIEISAELRQIGRAHV